MYRLNPAQTELIAQARKLAEDSISPYAPNVDQDGRFPAEGIEALGAAGFMGLIIPTEYGGMGQPLRLAAAIVEEIAKCCGSSAMVYMMHLCGISCYLAEPEKFSAQLKAAAKGEHLSTLAFSEIGSRSHFWVPVSKTEYIDGTVTLNAEKSWVTAAGVADGLVSTAGAFEAEGAAVFLVKKDDPGVSVSGKWSGLGLRGNGSAPMIFKDLKLDPATRLIGENGKGIDIMLGKALPVFQVCQGAIGVGLAEAAVAATQAHLTGQSFQYSASKLADLPILRSRLAEMRIETDKARAYLSAVLDKMECGAADTMLHVLAVKVCSDETAVNVTDLGMRACGGAAFSKHLALERVFRDARAATVMAPTTDVLREFIGRVLVGLPLFS